MSIDEYKVALSRHDWTYNFSDDHSVWQRGGAEESRLMAAARVGGDEFKRAFNAEYARYFHTDNFVKPFVFPFPEVQL